MVGKTVLQYRIQKEIGKGGMGVVYKAEDTKLNRTVAIKALSADLLGDEKARSRFLREARAASAIDHPNICTVYEINETEGSLFFVMQYVDGRTLKKHIGNRPLPLDQALDLSLQLADAITEAHHRNVVHRDIKSSNIMVNERGQAKILDFGLAKLLRFAEIRTEEEAAAAADLTQAGTPFGTASYMSPEQARGEAADVRSDIFSLGVVMYEMLTGKLPFKGKSSVEVMHAVLHQEPEPLPETLPLQLRHLILKALAKESANRFQSTDAVLEGLRSLIKGHYAGLGGVPADRPATLQAALSAQVNKNRGPIAKLGAWFRRMFSGGDHRTADSHPSATATPADPSSSVWLTSEKKTLAILPFTNLAHSPETEFYGFSLADSVITELAQIRDLIVRPSSYIARYQNVEIDPRAAGEELAVDAVLIGGYIKSGDRFRVTPQLVDIKSGEIVWSEKIDVSAKDIISLQDTISRQIVDGLRVKTSSREQEGLVKAPTRDPVAYENYLKARNLLYKFISQTLALSDIEAAVQLFQAAVDADPEFALAHSGLGVCYINFVLKGIGGIEYASLAKNAFDTALSIEPRLLEARVRLIYVYLIEGDTELARREIKRLLSTAHNEPSVHSMAAYVFRLSGQYDKALSEWDSLINISPTDVVIAGYNRARIYMYRGEYEQAEREIKTGLAFEPNHPLLRAYGAAVDYYEGNPERAAHTMEEVLAKTPSLYSYKTFLGFCYVAMNERDRALALIDDKLLATAGADQDTAYWLGSLYALAGRVDQSIEWLERAISMGNENYPWFLIDQNWKNTREDPRYKKVMEDLRARWERIQREESK